MDLRPFARLRHDQRRIPHLTINTLLVINVTAAVIFNPTGDQILISRRLATQHQGGKWEFPGGKIESGETSQTALIRELHEELGITVTVGRQLKSIRHDYPDKSVSLDFWRVDHFTGQAEGREGQEIRWVNITDLAHYTFPEANKPVVSSLLLPNKLLITPDAARINSDSFLQSLEKSLLTHQINLVQFRSPSLNQSDYCSIAAEVLSICHHQNARLILNSSISILDKIAVDGLHLNSRRLATTKQRPIGHEILLSSACHNQLELTRANAIDVDFLLISPIKKTASHPSQQQTLLWGGFTALLAQTNTPAYALGGLTNADLDDALGAGAQGIAGISAFWSP